MATELKPDTPVASNEEISSLLNDITLEGKNFTNGQAGARDKIIAKAQSLIDSLRTPSQSLLWVTWAEPTRGAAVRLAIELKLFKTLVAEGGRPKSTEELAKPTGATLLLVQRIVRHLAATGMCRQTGFTEWAPNSLTSVFADDNSEATAISCWDIGALGFAKLTDFFTERNFQYPKDASDGIFEYAYGTSFFPFLGANPKVNTAFNTYMARQWEVHPYWSDIYPVKERLLDGMKTEGDEASIVDVGGSVGHVMTELLKRFPDTKGQLIVQDQAHVVSDMEGRSPDPRVKFQAHDFFTPEPVKGARAYYLRWILHDWPDDACKKILAHLKDAMTPGYSKLIINDNLLPDKDIAWPMTSIDLFVMELTLAHERTVTDWKNLVESVGLKYVGKWEKEPGKAGVIEVEL